MKLGRIAAIYSIVIGLSMLGMWAVFVATGQVPELATEPIRISLHILGEIATALALIAGGYGIWARKKWGLQAYMLSMGMLLYTLIVSPGYYAQKGDIVMTGMFGTFFVLAILFTALSFVKPGDYQGN